MVMQLYIYYDSPTSDPTAILIYQGYLIRQAEGQRVDFIALMHCVKHLEDATIMKGALQICCYYYYRIKGERDRPSGKKNTNIFQLSYLSLCPISHMHAVSGHIMLACTCSRG